MVSTTAVTANAPTTIVNAIVSISVYNYKLLVYRLQLGSPKKSPFDEQRRRHNNTIISSTSIGSSSHIKHSASSSIDRGSSLSIDRVTNSIDSIRVFSVFTVRVVLPGYCIDRGGVLCVGSVIESIESLRILLGSLKDCVSTLNCLPLLALICLYLPSFVYIWVYICIFTLRCISDAL